LAKSSIRKFEFKSMTGFGESSGEHVLEDGRNISLRVQCKSVNHRFIDMSIKSPAVYSAMEIDTQKKIKSHIARGRIEILVQREEQSPASEVSINRDYIESVIRSVSGISVSGVEKDDLVRSFLPAMWQKKEVFEVTSRSGELCAEEKKFFLEVLDAALTSLCVSRKKEGEALSREVSLQLDRLETCIKEIEKLSADAAKDCTIKLRQRVTELLGGHATPEDPRILTEVALLADRMDIREELVRSFAHIDHFRSISSEGGRKLDFLLQEMVRECNTIASKTTRAEVSALVVEAKSILEKMREQLQNIE
jgi:uncharacterized protein (TIGR00255 family)